jgi:hypothetical protein
MFVEVRAMKGAFNWLSFGVVALLLGLMVPAAAGKPAPTRKLTNTGRPIAVLAMDGGRVIYGTDDNAVRVWDLRSGKSIRLNPGTGRYMTRPRVIEIALATDRATWITLSAAGNSEETLVRLYTKPLEGGATRKVGASFRADGYSDNGVQLWGGGWLTGLAGGGHVLAVSRWTTTPKPDQSGNVVSNARLVLIGPSHGRLHVIATGDQSIVSAGVDRGRIAVLRPDESIGIVSAHGALLREITPSSAREIAYGGGRLLVLTNTQTLEVYDAENGRLLHSWPVHPSGRLLAGSLSVYGRLGLYFYPFGRATQRLHVVDLATGREHVFPAGPDVENAHAAALGQLGLVYARNRFHFGPQGAKAYGTLVFLSRARVLAMLGAR